jgi:hypothetical protein
MAGFGDFLAGAIPAGLEGAQKNIDEEEKELRAMRIAEYGQQMRRKYAALQRADELAEARDPATLEAKADILKATKKAELDASAALLGTPEQEALDQYNIDTAVERAESVKEAELAFDEKNAPRVGLAEADKNMTIARAVINDTVGLASEYSPNGKIGAQTMMAIVGAAAKVPGLEKAFARDSGLLTDDDKKPTAAMTKLVIDQAGQNTLAVQKGVLTDYFDNPQLIPDKEQRDQLKSNLALYISTVANSKSGDGSEVGMARQTLTDSMLETEFTDTSIRDRLASYMDDLGASQATLTSRILATGSLVPLPDPRNMIDNDIEYIKTGKGKYGYDVERFEERLSQAFKDMGKGLLYTGEPTTPEAPPATEQPLPPTIARPPEQSLPPTIARPPEQPPALPVETAAPAATGGGEIEQALATIANQAQNPNKAPWPQVEAKVKALVVKNLQSNGGTLPDSEFAKTMDAFKAAYQGQ